MNQTACHIFVFKVFFFTKVALHIFNIHLHTPLLLSLIFIILLTLEIIIQNLQLLVFGPMCIAEGKYICVKDSHDIEKMYSSHKNRTGHQRKITFQRAPMWVILQPYHGN